jgi:glycosyltransferase involved in cell wall biosynthesis
MIKVLYNALHLTGQFSGVQHTVEQLMKEAFANPAGNISLDALCPFNYQLEDTVHSPQKLIKINMNTSNRWKRIGYEHFLMSGYFSRKEKHLLHCPAYIRPWHWNALSVITVHDMIALDFPEYCSSENRLYFNLLLPRSILKASKIITMSHSVKEDILRKFNLHPDKIDVIYPGINKAYFTVPTEEKLLHTKIKYSLPEKFILYVGNIEPKKNISRLIEAFEHLIHRRDISHSLVIAGRFAWKYKDVLQTIGKHQSGRILFPGYIEQSDLPALYTLADLFVFPSLYEGFGIPPLESMACGTPVIVSNKGALPETTGGCAVMVDPLSVDSITSAMLELLQNQALRNQLIRKGKQHVRQFNWERSWLETAKLYKSLPIL